MCVNLVARALLCMFLFAALHYEVLLKESRPANEQGSPKITASPSQERIDTCFRVFGKRMHTLEMSIYLQSLFVADELLVHLGVYQRVMKIVRDELYGES